MKAIIIDDEQDARIAVKKILKQHFPSVELIGEAENGTQGLVLIQSLHPELVLLDIELPDLDGFQILRKLDKIDFALVFITAFNKYAIKAFEFSAIDYILKPIDQNKFAKALIKAQERLHMHFVQEQYQLLLEIVSQKNKPNLLQQRISFSTIEGITYAVLKDIIRIEADQNCSSIYIKGLPSRIFIARNIGAYEEMFEEYNFMFRVHRSHLVNLHHVIQFSRETGGMLCVNQHNKDGEVKIPVSNTRREELLIRLGRLSIE